MLSYQKQLSALGWLQPETTLLQGRPTKTRLAIPPASFLIQLNILHLSSPRRENMNAEFLESWWWWVFLRVQDPIPSQLFYNWVCVLSAFSLNPVRFPELSHGENKTKSKTQQNKEIAALRC